LVECPPRCTSGNCIIDLPRKPILTAAPKEPSPYFPQAAAI